MYTILSDKEKKLQRHLIPVNIIVCILCIVAIYSLVVLPVLTVDFGRILRDEHTQGFVDEYVTEMLEKSAEGEEQNVDYAPVVTQAVNSVFGSVEGSVSFSALDSLKVFVGSGDSVEKFLDDEFFGENALISRLVDSILDGISTTLETEEGKQMIEESMITAITSSMVKDNPQLAETMTQENVKELTQTFKEIEKIEDGNVAPVVDNVVEKLETMLEQDVSEADRENITAEVQKIYDRTVEELPSGEAVTMESLICVAISTNVNLDEVSLYDLIKQYLNGEGDNGDNTSAVRMGALVAAEPVVGADPIVNPDPITPEPAPQPEPTPEQPSSGKVVTSYSQLAKEVEMTEEEKAEIKQELNTKLKEQVSAYTGYIKLYGLLFLATLPYIVCWLVLFIFSFVHIFMKNKRTLAWYVFLGCYQPALLWLALTVAPTLIGMFVSDARVVGLSMAGLAGLSTFTWVSGLCYVLLVLISICWAFPVKHMIREERKYCSRINYAVR